MRTIIINGLLAAAALLPTIAQAQDDRGNRGGWQRRGGDAGQDARGGDRQPGVDRPRPAPRADGAPGSDNGQWQRPERPHYDTPGGAPAPRPNWQGGQQQPRPDTPGGPPAPRPNWQGGEGRPHYDTPGGAPAPRPNWQGGEGRPRYDTPGGAPAPRPNWQGGDHGGRPGYSPQDRRRDYIRRQQFQRSYNDWNDDFRDGSRFADRRDWNNRGWNRGWRNESRYDWNRYRGTDRNRYHLPRYYAPYGWDRGYRRFSIGVTLSSVLFGQNYWIDDAYGYRLPPAYGPYRWVRYYNDALLVDVRNGIVVDTVYDIFW